MPHLRTKLLAAVAVSAVSMVFMPVAHAAPASTTKPDQYDAQAVATALRISVFGQGLTIGSASSEADSSPKAHAEGHGALIATQNIGSSTADATKAGQSNGSDTPTCSPLVLPAAVPLLDLSAACSNALAAVTASGPASSAAAKSVTIKLSGDPALAALPIDTLTDTLTTTLIGGLGPLLDTTLPVPTNVVVDQLKSLLNKAITGAGVDLLTIEGGAAESHTSADGDSVDASTLSNGATIKLLDRSGIGMAPILQIDIGQSTTNVSRVRATGVTTADATAIPVKVTVAPDVAFLLNLPQSSFSAPEGQQVDLPLPPPLTSSIKLSGGSTADIKNGKSAASGSLDLDLLQGLNGGIQVGLSTGSAAVAGTVATKVEDKVTPVAPVAPAPPSAPAVNNTSLPRTGIEETDLIRIALVLAIAAAGIGGLVLTASRRSRSAKA